MQNRLRVDLENIDEEGVVKVLFIAERELESSWSLCVSLKRVALTHDVLDHRSLVFTDIVQLRALQQVEELVRVGISKALVQTL